MGETFYSVLGVAEDADVETIRSAYRSLVKEHHPDVSDDPRASEQFKRLTTAKDVLVDEDERSRYDRLGHDRYVREHVESTVWTPTSGRGTGNRRREKSPTRRHRRTDSASRDWATWIGDDVTSTSGGAGQGRPTSEQRRARRHTGSSRADGQGWQYASNVYQPREADVESTGSTLGSLVAGLRRVGPWLAIHFVFILSALATGWFTYTQAEETVGLSVPSVTFGILIVGLVIFLSLVHVVSRLYT